MYFFNLNLNWLTLCFLLFFINHSFWTPTSAGVKIKLFVVSFIFSEFCIFFKYNYIKKGAMLVLVTMFMFILLSNFLGLIPYVFSNSSHLAYTLTFSFPLWVGLMFLGWGKFAKSMFSHLIPMGTPLLLIPLMVGVETVSCLIRPISLSVRLMSNMISGHLLMSLLGNCGFSMLAIQLVFFLFEIFVCFIQAYVFAGLIALYSGEV